MAKVPPYRMPRDEMKAELDRLRHPLRVVVDRAKNPFNIGAIVRTAHSFLVKEIILIGAEPWYERAAMGMLRYEHIREVPTSEEFVFLAASEGWPILAFEKDEAAVGVWDVEMPDHCALVFGNEDDGCAPCILEAAASVVGIPMFGINHSYPIAIAAGMGMAEWARRRYQHGRSVVPSKI